MLFLRVLFVHLSLLMGTGLLDRLISKEEEFKRQINSLLDLLGAFSADMDLAVRAFQV